MPIIASLSSPYGPQAAQRVDVFVPAGGEERALVACFAGGWWTGGRQQELRACCLALAEAGLPAAAIGVRPLAAPGSAPGAEHARSGADILADARAGLGRALDEAALAGHGGRSCALLGSGSGSLVALVLAHRLGAAGGRGGEPLARCAVACGVTPGLDHHEVGAGVPAPLLDRFAGTAHTQLAPLHLEPAAFPPLLLVHGDADAEVPPAIAERLHQRLAEAGEADEFALLAGLGHQFIERPWEPAGRLALDRVVPFLLRHAPDPQPA